MEKVVRYTVFGSKGYVGSHLAKHLQTLPGVEVLCDSIPLPKDCLGHVFYCIGVTTDFKTRLHDTMRAHVCKAQEILAERSFQSFTYLSSTRVYEGATTGAEDCSVIANPSNMDDFYKISKLAGEAICLTDPRSTIRVVRLSNVLGMENPPLTFVPSIIREAIDNGEIVLKSALNSAKDYILIEDVVRMLPKIARGGESRIYNLASGQQIEHLRIVEKLCASLGCTYRVTSSAPRAEFPNIEILRLVHEFEFMAQSIMDGLVQLCGEYRKVAKMDEIGKLS